MSLEKIVRGFALVGGVILLGVMLLIVYSVVMRYVFNAPPFFTLDTAQMLLVPVVFFGLAYCGWTGGHIAVDLIGVIAPPGVVRWTDAAVRLVCAAVMGLLTWRLVDLAIDAREYGEATNLIEIPHFPFVLLMVVGAGLYGLVLVALAVRSLRGQGDPPPS